MNAAIAEPSVNSVLKIPVFLVKEEINGKPYYYKGYGKVLSKQKKLEEIMGCSTLQSLLVAYLLKCLYVRIDEDVYDVFTNETGLHLKHRSNVACDIAIYEKKVLIPSKIDKHYSTVAPKIVIEVDVDIDLQEADTVFSNDYKYIREKIDALFEFGVEKVLWVISDAKQVIVATPNDDWRFVDWNKNIEILEDISFNIGTFLQKRGVES